VPVVKGFRLACRRCQATVSDSFDIELLERLLRAARYGMVVIRQQGDGYYIEETPLADDLCSRCAGMDEGKEVEP